MRAGDSNPYAPIVDRNVFGLLPPPAANPDAAAQAQENSLPKITVGGIMDVFGNLKVLFKTTTKQPGSKENYYDLAQGQSEDDIEVVKIDQKAGLVTFNNNGFSQDIPLAEEPNSGGSGGGGNQGGVGGRSFGGGPPGFGRPGPGGFNRGFPAAYNGGNGGYNNGGYNNGGGGYNGGGFNNDNNGGLNFNGNQFHQAPIQPAPQVTPEAQVLMIEAERMQLQNQGDSTANILPPTPLTGMLQNGDGGTGETPTPPPP